jgi:D-arabinose 1-dehydrogenase-like Zn-dependent alcohol dehydrogenase
MKAALLTEYGSVAKLTCGKCRIRSRDRTKSRSGVNPIDWKIRIGSAQKRMPMALPAILGRNVSGTVVAIGPGVTTLPVGTRVMGNVPHGYAELVIAPSNSWTEVPSKMDLVDAGAYPLVLLTGAQLVEDAHKSVRGTPCSSRAVGRVGRVAVFVAKQRGARVLAGVRTDQKAARPPCARQVLALATFGEALTEHVDHLPLLGLVPEWLMSIVSVTRTVRARDGVPNTEEF